MLAGQGHGEGKTPPNFENLNPNFPTHPFEAKNMAGNLMAKNMAGNMAKNMVGMVFSFVDATSTTKANP